MRVCQKCNQDKSIKEFSKDKTRKDGLAKWCKLCASEYFKAYRKNNKEILKQKHKRYYEENAERLRLESIRWNRENPDRRAAVLKHNYDRYKAEGRLDQYYGNVDRERNKLRAKMWREMNKGRVNANIAKRRASLLQATPKWAEYDAIIDLYKKARELTEQTGIDHQVDHIIPLNSKLVCGLHCMANLQILTAEENNKKKNKLI